MNFQPSEKVLDCMNNISSFEFSENCRRMALSYYIFYQIVYKEKCDIGIISDDFDLFCLYLDPLLISLAGTVSSSNGLIHFMFDGQRVGITFANTTEISRNPHWFITDSKDLMVVNTQLDVWDACTNAADPDLVCEIIGI